MRHKSHRGQSKSAEQHAEQRNQKRTPSKHVPMRALGWSPNTSRMNPKWLQNGSKITPKLLPKGPWSTLGGLLGAFWRLFPLFCPVFALQRASWNALGRLRGRKKDLLSGSWAFQEESQDRFQPSWRPKGSQTGAQKGAKTRSKSDSSSKVRFL